MVSVKIYDLVGFATEMTTIGHVYSAVCPLKDKNWTSNVECIAVLISVVNATLKK